MFPQITPFLLAIVGVLLLAILILALRQRIYVRIGFRNIRRRKVNTLLIVLGAMIGTTIITTAMLTGDTLDYSIKKEVYEKLGEIDITIRREQNIMSSRTAAASDNFLPYAAYDEIKTISEKNDLIENSFAALTLYVPLEHIDTTNKETILAEPYVQVLGVDMPTLCDFEKMPEGECPLISKGEAVVTADLAQSLDLHIGDTAQANYYNQTYEFTIGHIIDRTGVWQLNNGPISSLNMFVNLDELQAIVSMPQTASFDIPPQVLQMFGQADITEQLQELTKNPPSSYDELPTELKTWLEQNGLADMAKQMFENDLVQIPANPISRIFISLQGDVISGQQYSDEVESWLHEQLDDSELTNDYNLEIRAVKANQLTDSVEAAESITTMFLVLGGFSALAGTLLIINIFVMLAEERKSEMGIMRAIGLKRRDLVKVFSLEGSVYAAVASVLGIIAGFFLAFIAIKLMEYIFNSVSFINGDFNLVFTWRIPSLINSYCLGLLITLASIVITSWKISKINIVHAIRDITAFPVQKFAWRKLILPILLLVIGLLLSFAGFAGAKQNPVMALLGPCLAAIAISMTLKFKLKDRLVFTLCSLFILVYSIFGYTIIDDYFQDEVVFIIVGLLAVFSSVIFIIYNDRVVLWPLEQTLGRLKKIQAIIKIVVTYPLSSRFRTGMTLAMYSLIIFTVVMISILKTTQSATIEKMVAEQTGGYELMLTYNQQNPIVDLKTAIAEHPELDSNDFAAIGQITQVYVSLDEEKYPELQDEETEQSEERTIPLSVQGVDAEYVESTKLALDARSNQYTSDTEAWQALVDHPEYIIVDSRFDPNENANSGMHGMGTYPQIDINDSIYLCPMQSEDNCFERTVIGRLTAISFGLYANIEGLEQDLGISRADMFRTYQIDVKDGVDLSQISVDLEKAFIKNGVEVTNIEEQVNEILSLMNTFFTLMQGFLAMGLVAGIAGLSIIMIRSVHERRQQIGVLRAIGFKSKTVLWSFLGETTFVAMLGILIGTLLGGTISYFLFREEIQSMSADASFTIPWVELTVIIGITYVFSLLGTIWPSLKASRLAPAEVLRYRR